jgi:hypothetical protein
MLPEIKNLSLGGLLKTLVVILHESKNFGQGIKALIHLKRS